MTEMTPSYAQIWCTRAYACTAVQVLTWMTRLLGSTSVSCFVYSNVVRRLWRCCSTVGRRSIGHVAALNLRGCWWPPAGWQGWVRADSCSEPSSPVGSSWVTSARSHLAASRHSLVPTTHCATPRTLLIRVCRRTHRHRPD